MFRMIISYTITCIITIYRNLLNFRCKNIFARRKTYEIILIEIFVTTNI